MRLVSEVNGNMHFISYETTSLVGVNSSIDDKVLLMTVNPIVSVHFTKAT